VKILFFSDLHIADDSRVDVIRQCRTVVYQEHPDIIVLGGDIFDPWKAHWSDICQTTSYQLIDDMTKWVRAKTIYINQNHDYNAPAWVLPSAYRCGQYDSGVWRFLHGWEFSWDWGIFGPALFWLSTHHPELMIPLHKAFYPHHEPIPGQHDKRQDWTVIIGGIHARARLYAQKNGICLCIGHTHCPSVFDGLMIDGGDMIDSLSYIVIPDDAKPVAELRMLNDAKRN